MLDGQTHLVKQGWKGAGHPLKEGGRARPVVIAQKKTLGGVGKDRDESFAFWDHLYDVAAKSIKFKIPAEDGESDEEREEQISAPTFHRTQTGIISNRRPTSLPTPSSSKSPSPLPSSVSIISRAKQEAARRSLYSRFLRGPLITQESLNLESPPAAPVAAGNVTSTPPAPVVLSPPIATTSMEANGALLVSTDDRKIRKAERAARRQARAERREAKTLRRAARAERKARKAEEAARKAAKIQKKTEKENKKLLKANSVKSQSATELGEAPKATAPVASLAGGEQKRKDKKKRKRDTT
ncbi:hypothetical protein RhiJN_14384 [Ceratobasidium sp. AG-Ba]|nr:hypothetical protein RhiJN_14384 [Ceratobasidium sp. AG-Ba]QRW14934.1 hypothetical protein RhiLY_13933 [Ceratobasidium sp. AG-Ba]